MTTNRSPHPQRVDAGRVLAKLPAELRPEQLWIRRAQLGLLERALAVGIGPGAIIRTCDRLDPGDAEGQEVPALRYLLSELRADVLAGDACPTCGQDPADAIAAEICEHCHPDADDIDPDELAAFLAAVEAWSPDGDGDEPARLEAGWPAEQVAVELAPTQRAAVRALLAELPLAEHAVSRVVDSPPRTPSSAPAGGPREWCRKCDRASYRYVTDDDGLNPTPCLDCHQSVWAAGNGWAARSIA